MLMRSICRKWKRLLGNWTEREDWAMWRESSTDCQGTEEGDCGHCTRFGRAAHKRPARLLSTHGWGRKSCSLCEEVDLDSPVFKHVLEWHMNRCLFMKLVYLTNPLPGHAVCVHLLEWLFCDVSIYVCNCAPFWVNNNELLKPKWHHTQRLASTYRVL